MTGTIEKFYLKRVRLNSGGYDSSGEYFGIGATLYQYQADSMYSCRYIRAYDRNHAKKQISLVYPQARFFK